MDNRRSASRRKFLSLIANEMRGIVEGAKGNLPLRLVDLPTLPDHRLALIKPVVAAGVCTVLDDGDVRAQVDGQGVRVLCQRGTPEEFALARFDGDHALSDVGHELVGAGFFAADAEAFACVKGFFLRLIASGVCFPSNPIGPEA